MGNGTNSKDKQILADEMQLEDFKGNFTAIVKEVHELIVERNFNKLRVKLEILDRNQKKQVADFKLGEYTCLSRAVKQKSSEIVEYLLDKCGTNPNTITSWKKRGKENIHEDVPLLCWACINGNNEMGKLLIQGGADVNYCNRNGESLVHISYKHQNKKYGSDSSIVNLVFITNLLRAGTRVNHANCDRDTLLHLAHQVGDSELCKLLLSYGANSNLVNKRGFSAVEEAAIFVYAIEQEPPPSTPIETLLSVDKTLSKYKINALEILGTRQIRSFLKSLSSSNGTLGSAYQYWVRAMSMATSNNIIKENTYRRRSDGLFTDIFEPQSIVELNQISCSYDLMIKVGILFAERIFGLSSIHTITLLKLFSKWYNNVGQAKLGKRVFGHVLECVLKNAFNTDKIWLQYLQDVLMSWFKSCELLGEHHCHKTSYILLEFLKFLERVIDKTSSNSVSNQTSSLILYFIHVIAECDEDTCKLRLYQIINKLNKLDLRQDDLSLLYLAVKNYIYEMNFKRRSMKAIQRMLEQGMSPDTVDQAGDTPLLMCLDYKIQSYLPSDEIKVLLMQYSHLDIRNRQNKTALSLLKVAGYVLKEVQYRTLQCLAAEVIRKNKIPFKDRVPRKLEKFVEMH